MGFGAKISVSMVEGFAFVDKLDWNAYHEGQYIQESIEAYRNHPGVYPEAVLADQIYCLSSSIYSFIVFAVKHTLLEQGKYDSLKSHLLLNLDFSENKYMFLHCAMSHLQKYL